MTTLRELPDFDQSQLDSFYKMFDYAEKHAKYRPIENYTESIKRRSGLTGLQGICGTMGSPGPQGTPGNQGIFSNQGIQGATGYYDYNKGNSTLSQESIEDAIERVLNKHGLINKNSSTNFLDQKTFTVEEIIKIIESMESKEFEQNWGISFGGTTVYTDTWIRKNDVIEKFKNL